MKDVVDLLLKDWARERPDLDASAMAIVGRIIALGKQLENRANHVLVEFDLPYWGLDVLATLRRSGQPYRLSPSVLRRSMLISSGAMTNRLDRLESRELVRREPDPNDRRGSQIVLTTVGRRLIDRAIAARFEEAADAVAGLKRTEQAQLRTLLAKLTESLTLPTQAPAKMHS
jgi:DNA-binding MarR family transcriptional regulator